MQPILTAKVGDNGDLFPDALALYSQPGDRILDMTWGLGVFWKNVDQSCYDLVRNDIDPARGDVHFDFRHVDFPSESFHVVVFDPPYASRVGTKIKASIGGRYNNNQPHLKTVEDMMRFYHDGMVEANRLLEVGGILFVKCQDEIASSKQHRNHISIRQDALEIGFIDEDLFVLIQKVTPTMRHTYQYHARKNNSFLWVFRKS
jgi:hypothetical protein